MTAPNCIYCGSTDTEGFDIGGDVTHVECAACGCAFPTESDDEWAARVTRETVRRWHNR